MPPINAQTRSSTVSISQGSRFFVEKNDEIVQRGVGVGHHELLIQSEESLFELTLPECSKAGSVLDMVALCKSPCLISSTVADATGLFVTGDPSLKKTGLNSIVALRQRFLGGCGVPAL